MLLYEIAGLSEDDITRHVIMPIAQKFGSLDAYLEADQQGSMFAAAMGPHAYKRTFCCTKDGYMGLVPPESRVSDVVCILFRMQTPVILRKIEDGGSWLDGEAQYELIGECYMHGMMDGEMLNKGLERTRFTLR
ncbi:hypothetical protein BGZ60DRAFT_414202 [Tricladium varicosporioides]|nr:hypothetical protein BGZ60DRAFT_414202 [Hymenoscyphus varicosporioides]